MYVVKCFTAAGFDTIDVNSKIDVSAEPGNSIERIEQYISMTVLQKYSDSVNKRVSLGKRPLSGQRSDGRKKRGFLINKNLGHALVMYLKKERLNFSL